MSQAVTAEQLKKQFQEIKDDSGRDLYSHLQAVFSKILLERPENPVATFEELSHALKLKSACEGSDGAKTLGLSALKEWVDTSSNFLAKAQVGTDDEPVEPEPTGFVPDLMTQSQMFKLAGIHFGEDETYRLVVSLKKLAQSSGAKDVRLWGRIYGTEKDYYIAEGSTEGGDAGEGEEENKNEPHGSGVNVYTYWATNSVLAEWVQLPDISPEFINAARSIKKMFTGDLERTVIANPFFFGQEKHLLRAQIARISHSTSIIPYKYYKVVEDDAKNIEAEEGEEFVAPSTSDLTSLDRWVHFTPSILKAGRITHLDPEVPEGVEVEPEDLLKELEKQDPYADRLSSLDKDESVPGYEKNWTVKVLGDLQTYTKDKKVEEAVVKESISYATVVLKSLRWPGSTVCYKSGSWANIYVGYGVKYETVTFFPTNIPKVVKDLDDNEEQDEPNPKEVPVVEGGENAENAEGGEGDADPEDD